MERFVKFFYGLPSDVEQRINDFAKKNHFTIISCSMVTEKCATAVVFEKPFLAYDEKGGAE